MLERIKASILDIKCIKNTENLTIKDIKTTTIASDVKILSIFFAGLINRKINVSFNNDTKSIDMSRLEERTVALNSLEFTDRGNSPRLIIKCINLTLICHDKCQAFNFKMDLRDGLSIDSAFECMEFIDEFLKTGILPDFDKATYTKYLS